MFITKSETNSPTQHSMAVKYTLQYTILDNIKHKIYIYSVVNDIQFSAQWLFTSYGY